MDNMNMNDEFKLNLLDENYNNFRFSDYSKLN